MLNTIILAGCLGKYIPILVQLKRLAFPAICFEGRFGTAEVYHHSLKLSHSIRDEPYSCGDESSGETFGLYSLGQYCTGNGSGQED